MSKPPNLVRVQRLDSIPLDESFFTPEGFFIDTPIVTRTGIFKYKKNGKVRRELRLPEHVFASDSLATYEGKPIIITHDAGRVNKNNVSNEVVGTMLSEGYRDGENVRVKVVVHDINHVKRSGLRELSLGYDLVWDETPGTWNGQPYDAIQTNIVINHLALVRDARAGEQARLNLDSRSEKGATNMSNYKTLSGEDLKKAFANIKKKGLMNLDDVESVLLKELNNDSGDDSPKKPAKALKGDASHEEKFKLLKEKFDTMCKDNVAPTADYVKELFEYIDAQEARYDASKAVGDTKTVEGAEDGKGVAMNVDSIGEIISERINLGRMGDKLNLDGLEAMKPIDAKKAIVKAVLPTMQLDGRSEAYIEAAFDQASEKINTYKGVDYQRRQMSQRMDGNSNPAPPEQTLAHSARERMIGKMKEGGEE